MNAHMMMNIKLRTIVSFSILVFAIFSTWAQSNQTSTNKEGQTFLEAKYNTAGRISTDKTKRESSKFPRLQSTIINVLKPVPVVDTIREEEKYGNTGDKFNRLGRGVVNGVETVANVINSALNFPMEAVKKISRSATEALNNLGGKLVGLQ